MRSGTFKDHVRQAFVEAVENGREVERLTNLLQERMMTDDQIKYMVDRFLGWKLPADFNPDAGISFKPTFNDHTAHPMKHEPSGTNLFDAAQAHAMVRYMLEGMPLSYDLPFHQETMDGLSALTIRKAE